MDVIIENGSMCVFHRAAIWIVKSMLINGESRALPVFPKFTFRSHGMRFSVWTITRATRNFQMKLIHRFNRPISAPNFPQFPGNVPFCPRSLVPPIGPDRLRHGSYVRARVRSDEKYISRNYCVLSDTQQRDGRPRGRKCIFIFNVNGRARMRVTCRVQSMRATRVTGRVGELNKE